MRAVRLENRFQLRPKRIVRAFVFGAFALV